MPDALKRRNGNDTDPALFFVYIYGLLGFGGHTFLNHHDELSEDAGQEKTASYCVLILGLIDCSFAGKRKTAQYYIHIGLYKVNDRV